MPGPREVLKTEVFGLELGFQQVSRNLANANVLENNVWPLSLHKFNVMFVKICENVAQYFVSVWQSTPECIVLLVPRASHGSRWLSSLDSTSVFQKCVHFKTSWSLYKWFSGNSAFTYYLLFVLVQLLLFV